MARRFKSRATAGRTFKTGVMVQFTAVGDILSSATRGDGDAGTYVSVAVADVQAGVAVGVNPAVGTFVVPRSEERRVGKECKH